MKTTDSNQNTDLLTRGTEVFFLTYPRYITITCKRHVYLYVITMT